VALVRTAVKTSNLTSFFALFHKKSSASQGFKSESYINQFHKLPLITTTVTKMHEWSGHQSFYDKSFHALPYKEIRLHSNDENMEARQLDLLKVDTSSGK
jgi:hypothetical protein